MKNREKITSILIISSMSMMILSGCGSTTGATNTTTAITSKASKFDPISIKALYVNTLKTLVKDKTITKVQSDKILATVITNVPQGTGPNMPKTTDNKNSANWPPDTNPKNDQIASLVTSGVITQVQADTINAKLSQAMKINRSKQIN